MKTKYLAIMLLAMLAGVSVKAQYSDQYYHRIGDTLMWRNPICHYQWWDAEYNYNNRLLFHLELSELRGLFNGIRLCRYYTPDTMKVIGLCVMGHNFTIPTDSTEYLYLYDADGEDFTLKARVPWRLFRLDSCRYLHLIQHRRGGSGYNYVDTAQCWGVTYILNRDSCCVTCSHRNIYPMFEYYFDTDVYVTDSFYVGGSSFSNYGGSDNNYPAYYAITRPPYGISIIPYGISCEDPSITNGESPDCLTPRFLYRMWLADTLLFTLNGIDFYGNTFHLPYQKWAWRELAEYLLIVPIIQVDTTVPVWNYCPPVENVQVSLVEDSCLILTWDDCVNYSSVTVRYGVTPQGGATQWHEIETEDNIFRLCGIDTLSEYRFTLQAHCDTSKQETDWSEELVYQYPVRHDVGTGDTPLSRHTHLVPNPAHESVVVNTGYTLRRIEVYNSRGILVYSEPAWGLTTTIDLTGWPSGSYIVVVGTQKGRTAKVLVKE